MENNMTKQSKPITVPEAIGKAAMRKATRTGRKHEYIEKAIANVEKTAGKKFDEIETNWWNRLRARLTDEEAERVANDQGFTWPGDDEPETPAEASRKATGRK